MELCFFLERQAFAAAAFSITTAITKQAVAREIRKSRSCCSTIDYYCRLRKLSLSRLDYRSRKSRQALPLESRCSRAISLQRDLDSGHSCHYSPLELRMDLI